MEPRWKNSILWPTDQVIRQLGPVDVYIGPSSENAGVDGVVLVVSEKVGDGTSIYFHDVGTARTWLAERGVDDASIDVIVSIMRMEASHNV